MYYSEKRAKIFLEENGFEILDSFYFDNENQIKKFLAKSNFPIVMKVDGSKIVHKAKVGGVKLNIQNFSEAVKTFNQFKKINGFEGVIIQKQIEGREFILGIKKTPEFGHVFLFGSGGHDVEKIKDVSFRVSSLSKKEILDMIDDTKVSKKLDEKDKVLIANIVMKFNSLIKKNKNILELDINPLILSDGKAKVVDARILFE